MGWRIRLNDGSVLTPIFPTRGAAHHEIAQARLSMPKGAIDPRWFDPDILTAEEVDDATPTH